MSKTKTKKTTLIPKKYLGAFKQGHRAVSRPFIDDEFSYQLLEKIQQGCKESETTLEYIAKFNNEFYRCVLESDQSSNLHQRDVDVVGELDRKGKPVSQVKSIYDSHNARRRDLSSNRAFIVSESVTDLQGRINYPSDQRSDISTSGVNHESVLIDLLDLKNRKS